ncbi:Vegetative incompatibility WD repeat protein, partial [Rasamsonia emersonii CBS 393.64]
YPMLFDSVCTNRYIQTDGSTQVARFLYDTKRFIQKNRWIVDTAPLQLYSSAIIFAPEMSIVRHIFKDKIPSWISTLPKVESAWSAELQTLEGHSSVVEALAFSPDGKLVASGSHTVKLWDPATGALQQTLEGHSSRVKAVAFSPDGKLVASGSADHTVKLWDPATGALQQTLEGHSELVGAVAFSPDGKLVASGSGDGTVKLWDPATGALQQTLKVDTVIRELTFSKDGPYLETDSGPLNIDSLYTGTFAHEQRNICNIFVQGLVG